MPEQRPRGSHRPAVPAYALLGIGAVLLTSAAPTHVLGVRLAGTGGAGDSGNGRNKGIGNDKKVFSISGGVAGLYPGAALPLTLTLRSTSNFPIRVTALAVAVSSARAGCPSAYVSVSPYAGGVVIPADGTATTTLTATLAASAPEACKSATWALSYSGTAVMA